MLIGKAKKSVASDAVCRRQQAAEKRAVGRLSRRDVGEGPLEQDAASGQARELRRCIQRVPVCRKMVGTGGIQEMKSRLSAGGPAHPVRIRDRMPANASGAARMAVLSSFPESVTTARRDPKWVAGIVAAACVSGTILRLIQYLQGRPLWLDEAMLALNIGARGLPGVARTPRLPSGRSASVPAARASRGQPRRGR